MTMLSTKSKIQLLTVLLNDIKNDISKYSNEIQYESLSVFEGDGKPLLTLLDNNRNEIYLSFNEKGGLEANTGDESKDKTIERKYKINWLLKSLSIVIATLALTFATVSCKKPSDDPNPVNPINSNNPVDTSGNGNGNGTDTTSNNNTNKPAFKKVLYEVKSNGISQSFNLDVDGDNITIKNITGQPDNASVTYAGLNVTITPNNKVYAGTETLEITIGDGNSTITETVTVNIGSSSQIDTYNILSKYFTKTLISTLKIRGDGTISGGGDADFYEISSEDGPATYEIFENGNILMTALTVKMEYSISYSTANNIVFKLLSTTSPSYLFAVGNTFNF